MLASGSPMVLKHKTKLATPKNPNNKPQTNQAKNNPEFITFSYLKTLFFGIMIISVNKSFDC